MSNYVLYNYKDTPEDFYERLRINIDLNEEFKQETIRTGGPKTVIYSFPMRYMPVDAISRDTDTGNRHWNRRLLRGLQVILNVMKGPVMPGKSFFEQAFGRNAEEFRAILLMPDQFILNRLKVNWKSKSAKTPEKRLAPYARQWMTTYWKLTGCPERELQEYLSSNKFEDIEATQSSCRNRNIKKLLELHLRAEEVVGAYKNGEEKER